MLVLSACYFNTFLKQLIVADRFQRLLERTTAFLRRLGSISPTCAIDCQILEKINYRLFGIPPDEKHLYRNEVKLPSASNSFSHST